MIYKEDYTTAKGIKYKIYQFKGKISSINVSEQLGEITIKNKDNTITVKSNLSGLRGYNIDTINIFTIAVNENGTLYLRKYQEDKLPF